MLHVVKTRDLVARLEEFGWVYVREGKGSHRIYRHPDDSRIIVVPFHGWTRESLK